MIKESHILIEYLMNCSMIRLERVKMKIISGFLKFRRIIVNVVHITIGRCGIKVKGTNICPSSNRVDMDVIPVNVTSFPNALPMLNGSSSREYILYKLRIQHTFWKKKSLNCGGNLHLFCETGAVNYTVWSANITMCKDNSDTDDEILVNGNSMIIIVAAIIALVIVLLATCLVSTYKIYKYRRSRETEHPISDDAVNYHQVQANSEGNRESCQIIDF